MKSRILAGAAVLAIAAAAATVPAAAAQPQKNAFTFGVIGDVPYGTAQVAQFPEMVTELNRQDDLKFIAHLGDIKAGSAQCTDDYFANIKAQFDRFETPLVYTPGDNEWVDCHRANNGSYNPLERLDALRSLFFATPGKTLGTTMPVKSQAALGLPENVSFAQNRLAFTAVNVQGSNNSLAPWTGNSAPTVEQMEEVAVRTAADVAQIRQTFADAERTNARAVVVLTQADMFDPWQLANGAERNPEQVSGFTPIVEALADGAASFEGPVYLFNGDSHAFNDDSPLAAGSPWLGIYGVDARENLKRVTVEGAATSNEWLRVTVAPNSAKAGEVLSWERIAYAGAE